MSYKERFKQIVSNIDRPGIDELMLMLDKTDFYIAPASTRHHEAYEGGLVEHCVHVFDYLSSDDYTRSNFSLETIAVVALFHDLCKIGQYKVEMRNTKDENGKWIQVPYYTVDDPFPYGHGEKSVLMLQDFIKLSTDEIMAIRWHMGAYVGQQDWNTLANAYKAFPLALLLHQADMRATYLEKDLKKA